MPEFSSKVDSLRVLALLALRASGLNPRILLKRLSSAEHAISFIERKEFYLELSGLCKAVQTASQIEQALDELLKWQERGIQTLTIWESSYPVALRRVYQPPIILFYRGSWRSFEKTPVLSVVGSRRGDEAGCHFARTVSCQAAAAGVCIVSGLAFGIDAAAHQGALDSGAEFPTVAVLGNGLASVYPRRNERLAEQILAQGGLLISQFEPGMPALAHNFLERNRVIAGLSQAVLIVQATARSGSLVTARYALEEGRDVLAVPGDVRDPRYEGSNRLIKQGAYLVTCFEDICEHLPGVKASTAVKVSPAQSASAISQLAKDIVQKVARVKSMHIDSLRAVFKDAAAFSEALLELELNGVLRRLPGNYYEVIS